MALTGVPQQRNTPTGSISITLTGEFRLEVAGAHVPVPHSVERMLAYLALTSRPISRLRLAGTLWIDATDSRASNNLRTALWRLHRFGYEVVSSADDRVALAPQVRVDLTELLGLTRRLIDHSDHAALGELPRLLNGIDLLPDWDDEWVIGDRERFRLLRLEALEAAAEALLERSEVGRALDVALEAVVAEPLRESARRILVRIHLAQGNRAEAVRAYRAYRDQLLDEIGLEPSMAMRELIAPLQRVT
jgi:DNA-binding SARP family transcriptional activator